MIYFIPYPIFPESFIFDNKEERIMSRISRAVENMKNKADKTVTNFMGGECYTLDPLETLRMIAASSIFGEPSYYRSNVRDGIFVSNNGIITDGLFNVFDGKSTTEIFTEAIDAAWPLS